ncbi:MAG: ASPIC/UnbV domain-containing protein, partial [Bacteroidota bacterium]
LDYYVTNIGANTLYVNQGNNRFTQQAGAWRVKDEFTDTGQFTTGWGTFFADLNNDSYLDLFVANGPVYNGLDVDGLRQGDRLYRGLAEGRFANVSASAGLTDTIISRGAAYADFNADGLVDFVVISVEALDDQRGLYYYQNTTESSGGFISLELIDDSGTANHEAFGSWVKVYAAGRVFLRELSGGSSHSGQSSEELHFGLGAISEADSVVVRWPDGERSIVKAPSLNQKHTLLRSNLPVTTSIPHFTAWDKLEVFPNPTGRRLEVRGAYHQDAYQIFDATGRLVSKGELQGPDTVLSVDSLANGVYLLRVGNILRRFIVSR